ncbi:sugar phosphate isomerase/epimerase family protein [Subtercola frigoramans]|uniref:Inosose dehydratase n=1 Tax=Subtercola frigoramans TaxID=120298 RepID=A0ABS2L213_9MICO|nr:sugar phosphate isomerase/epimerase [Subtercola frigoramans]MBM7471119.1 inosose dehydratase [Subtercola frigoramans]
MTISADRIALNAIQWINVKEDPNDPDGPDVWLYREPRFRSMYPDVLNQVREAGFENVMMEVLDTQTLQNYAAMIADSGLGLGPGYCQIGIPGDHGLSLTPGSSEWVRWFDSVRRKAEESNFFGHPTIFLAPEVAWFDTARTMTASAVGADFDPDRLARVTEVLAEATEVLLAEGIVPGLHNHVGTWVETESEIDHVLSEIPELRASFDIGHLAWAGIDPSSMLQRYADRLGDLHVKDLNLTVARESRANPAPYKSTVDRGLFLEPGLGDLDVSGVLHALPAAFEGWIIIEVDRASMPPFDSALVSAEWMRSLLALTPNG